MQTKQTWTLKIGIAIEFITQGQYLNTWIFFNNDRKTNYLKIAL